MTLWVIVVPEGRCEPRFEYEYENEAPHWHTQPATRVQFGLGAVLQHSGTPSLRVAGFEDEDENEAPCRAKLRRPSLPQAAEDGRHWAASAAVRGEKRLVRSERETGQK